MKWFITGEPGSGKTTLVIKLVDLLRSKGISYDGFITKEIREGGYRIGFSIIDLKTSQQGLLASKKLKEGPMIGSYVVNLKDIDAIAVKAIERALNESQLVVCDEIGAMELLSKNFREIIEKALKSEKPMLATLHRRFLSYTEKVEKDESKLIYLKRENWNEVFEELSKEIVEYFLK